MRKVFLDRIFRPLLLASVSSPLVSDVSTHCGLCDGPCFSLSSTSLSSANRKKTDIVRLNTKLLNPSKVENTNYSSRETPVVLSPPHKPSDITTPFDDQWHESQWQLIGHELIYKERNVVKTRSQHGTILVNSSFEHK